MSEVIGGDVFPTTVPAMSENADIQSALKLYHYGQTTVPSSKSSITANSVAGQLYILESGIKDLKDQGIGSNILSGSPKSTSGAYNKKGGYVFVDKSSAAPVLSGMVARYQISAPTGTIRTGELWVDSDAVPLKLYVYSGTEWKAIV